MNKREKVLEMSFKRYSQKTSFIKDALDKKGCNRKETTKILKEHGLDSVANRVKLVRDLESKLENIICLEINTETYDHVVRELKKYSDSRYKDLNITSDLIKSFVGNRYFETINDMRSFKAICDGDFDTYKMFAGDSRELFMYCVIRVLSLITQDGEVVKNMSEIITAEYGKECDNEDISTYERVLKKEMGKEAYLVKGYKNDVSDQKICFYNGVIDIIEPVLREHGYDKYCDGGVKVENTECTKKENELTIEELQNEIQCGLFRGTEIIEEIMNNQNKEDRLCGELRRKANELTEFINIELRKKTLEFVEIINELENANVETKKSDEEVDSRELVELRTENARLKNELEILKVKAEGPSLKEFIQVAGGRGGNYQLSELYLMTEGMMQDDGNLEGRVINLLTMLESKGMSPYFGNKKLNEEFEIERRELSKRYMLQMPLVGDNEVVKVRLIRNGWMLDGQVIVLPLVVQL